MTGLLVYRNGSGYRVLRIADHKVTDNGHLRAIDEDGEGHLFSAGSGWHFKSDQKEVA